MPFFFTVYSFGCLLNRFVKIKLTQYSHKCLSSLRYIKNRTDFLIEVTEEEAMDHCSDFCLHFVLNKCKLPKKTNVGDICMNFNLIQEHINPRDYILGCCCATIL